MLAWSFTQSSINAENIVSLEYSKDGSSWVTIDTQTSSGSILAREYHDYVSGEIDLMRFRIGFHTKGTGGAGYQIYFSQLFCII